MKPFAFKTIIMRVLTFSLINLVSAQTFNFQSSPTDYSQFKIGYLRPSIDNYELSASAGVFEISANIPISENLNIVGSLPILNDQFEVDFGFGKFKNDEAGLGNIFIGLQTNPKFMDNKRHIFTYGIYIPTAGDKAGFVGFTAKYYEFVKYVTDIFSLYFNYAYQKITPGGLRLGIELGPTVGSPTGDARGDTETFLHYGLMAGASAKKFYFGLELVGLGILTEEVKNFKDRFTNSLTFGTTWKGGPFTPQIFYKLYLDEDFKKLVTGVLGIEIGFSVN